MHNLPGRLNTAAAANVNVQILSKSTIVNLRIKPRVTKIRSPSTIQPSKGIRNQIRVNS